MAIRNPKKRAALKKANAGVAVKTEKPKKKEAKKSSKKKKDE